MDATFEADVMGAPSLPINSATITMPADYTGISEAMAACANRLGFGFREEHPVYVKGSGQYAGWSKWLIEEPTQGLFVAAAPVGAQFGATMLRVWGAVASDEWDRLMADLNQAHV